MIYILKKNMLYLKKRRLVKKKMAASTKAKTGMRRVFFRLIACYVILVVIFAAVCGYSYYQALDMSVNNLMSRNRLIFESSAFTLRNTFKTIEDFTANLYALRRLQQLMSRSAWSEQGNTMDIYETIRALPALNDANDIITGYFIYIPAGDLIVAPGQGFTGISRYYDQHFAFSTQQGYADWRNEVLDGTGKSIHADWKTGQEIQYVMPMSNSASGGYSGKVIYRLHAQRLIQQLTHFSDSEAGCALVADMQGNVLAASAGNEALVCQLEAQFPHQTDSAQELTALGETYVLSSQTVPEFGVQMLILMPKSAIVEQANESIRGMLAILLWMLSIGVVLIVILILTNVLPLMNIASRAAQAETGARGMWMISEAFSQMEDRKLQLERRLEEQRLHLRNACVQRLVHADAQDSFSLEEMLRDSGLTIQGSHFRGVLIELFGMESQEASLTMILELLDQYGKQLTFLTFESGQVVTCLFSQDDRAPMDVRALLTHAYQTLRNTFGCEAAFYVGIPCDRLEKIAQSFSTAEWLMRISQHNEWLSMAEDNGGCVDFNGILLPEEEKKLENYLMTGEKGAAEERLWSIYRRNFVEHNIQGFNRQFLYCRLMGVLVACGANLSAQSEIPDRLMQMDGKAFFTWLNRRFSEYCERAQTQNRQRSQYLVDQVCAYIEANYGRYDLSLNSLAMHFGITGNYLSGLFKKQCGMNFSVYLEEVRIRHAEKMLADSGITIDEIAQRVGYISSDSFRRAFRRVRGVSPSRFRESSAAAEAETNGSLSPLRLGR